MPIVALLLMAALSGGPAGGVPERGLVLHLDAANTATLRVVEGDVAGWRSTAPGRATVAEAAVGRRPALRAADPGRRAVVRFDGRASVLAIPRFGRRMQEWTAVVVAAAGENCRGGGLVNGCPAGGHDYDPGFTVDLYQSCGRLDQVSVEGAGRIGGQRNQLRQGMPAGGLHVIVVERRRDRVRLRVDGVEQVDRPVSPATTVVDELRVGARHYAGSEREYLGGDIASVLLYDRTLAPGELARVEARYRVGDRERKAGEDEAMKAATARMRNRMVAPVAVERWESLAAFEASGTGKAMGPVSRMPLRTDIREALELASGHLTSLFDKDAVGEPYFYSNHRVDGTGVMLHSVNIGIPHVVGRCLLGIMESELLAGIPCPPDGLAILEKYLELSFDNEDHLNSYFDPARNMGRFVEFHNMREGLYGLVMLAQGRKSQWARDQAHLMLQTLDSITDANGEWSIDLLKRRGMLERSEGVSIMNAARMVDPLLACHRVTGDPLALKLAGLYARAGLRTGYGPDGHFTEWHKSSGHVHSITSSLSGITEYAILTRDDAMLKAVKRIVDAGVPDYFSSWGWGDEVFPEHPADEPSRGEMNQTGDVIRTGLLLGAAGMPEYYGLAERYLRGMVLPTQHREAELRLFLHDAAKPRDDSERNVLLRTVGGYAMQLPNDRMKRGDWPLSTLDITSGAAHAMAECWSHRLTSDGKECRLNLLFDVDSPEMWVKSALPGRGRIDFAARADRALAIRAPKWLNAARASLTVNRERRELVVRGGYVVVGPLRAGEQGTLQFEVPVVRERERVDGVTYQTLWAGDQVIRITPRGKVSPLPF